MKYLLIYVLLAAVLVLSTGAGAQTYCGVSFPNGLNPITEVQFGTLNNSSSASSSIAHEDFTGTSTTVYSGTEITMVVKGNTGGNFTDTVMAYFDWNQNGVFTDAGESFFVGTITNSAGVNLTEAAIKNITIGNGVDLGAVRMRVVKKRGAAGSSCNNSGYGQAEDYTLDVQQGVPCSGTPLAGTMTAPSSVCNNSPFALVLTGTTIGIGLSIQWEYYYPLAGWLNIVGATTSTYIVPGITAPTIYRASVVCANCGIDFSNSDSVDVPFATPTFSSPVCAGDAINVSYNPCNTCTVSTTGPNGFSGTQNFSIPNASSANAGWYVYTTTSGSCASAPDSFNIVVATARTQYGREMLTMTI
jgi:hypothetical protein